MRNLPIKLIAIFLFVFILVGCSSPSTDYINIIAEKIEVTLDDEIDIAIDSSFQLDQLEYVFDENLLAISDEGRFIALNVGILEVIVISPDKSISDRVLIEISKYPQPLPSTSSKLIRVEIESQFIELSEPTRLDELSVFETNNPNFLGYKSESGNMLDNSFIIEQNIRLIPVYRANQDDDTMIETRNESNNANITTSSAFSESMSEEPKPTIEDINIDDDLQVRLMTDGGELLDIISISPQGIITKSSFNVNVTPGKIFSENSVCNKPYDFETSITQSMILIVDQSPYLSPCIELDHLVISGELRMGETLQVHVSPGAADLEYRWFISRDNRDFFPMNHTQSSLLLEPLHNNHYLAVNVIGTGDYTGILKMGTSLITSELIIGGQSFIPIASRADLIAMNSSQSHTFAEGTPYELTANGGHTHNYALVNDINLSNMSWTPLFINERGFQGVFDGRGFTIRNLKIDNEYEKLGFFERLDGAIIRNLQFRNVNISASSGWANDLGIIAGTTRSGSARNNIIHNVQIINASIVTTGSGIDIGGLIGDNNGPVVLSNISVSVTIPAIEGENVGGIVGRVDANLTASSVTVRGAIGTFGYDNTYDVGGFFGDVEDTEVLTIIDSFNYAKVSGSFNVGGLIGYVDDITLLTFKNVSNHGTVKGYSDIGGFIGELDDTVSLIMSNIQNYGHINDEVVDYDSGGDIGGFIGYLDYAESVHISASLNNGTVSGIDGVGGFIGEIDGSNNLLNLIIENSTNSGIIISLLNSTIDNDIQGVLEFGGIIGLIEDYKNITMSSVFNNAEIMLTSFSAVSVYVAGGIIGFIEEMPGTILLEDTINHGNIQNYGDDTEVGFSTFNTDEFMETAIGGLIGGIHNSTSLEELHIHDSLNAGNLHSNQHVGGILGVVMDSNNSVDITISNSQNSGNISVQDESAGGFIGFIDGANEVLINLSTNSGIINGVNTEDPYDSARELGGFVGEADDPLRILSSTNLSSVHGSYDIGGFVGEADDDLEIINSQNTGSISGNYSIGGFVGESSNITLSGVFNTATLSGINIMGGLVGDLTELGYFSQSYNTGPIYSAYDNEALEYLMDNLGFSADEAQLANVGGLIGRAELFNSDENSLTLHQTFQAGSIFVNSSATDISGGAIYPFGVGGLAGVISGVAFDINQSYSIGLISAQAISIAGLIGIYEPHTTPTAFSTIIDSFSRMDISGVAVGAGLIATVPDTSKILLERIYVTSVIEQQSGTGSALFNSVDGELIISGSGVIMNGDLFSQAIDENLATVTGNVVISDTTNMRDIDTYSSYDIYVCFDSSIEVCLTLIGNNEYIWGMRKNELNEYTYPYLTWINN